VRAKRGTVGNTEQDLPPDQDHPGEDEADVETPSPDVLARLRERDETKQFIRSVLDAAADDELPRTGS
jgi:hypothetical protein